MNQKDLIMRTEVRFDRDRLFEAFQATADLPRRHHAVAVTSKPGSADPLLDGTAAAPAEEMDYRIINAEFRNTYIAEVLTHLPFPYGRTRLMTIPPQRCYPVHADTSIRFHLAIETHPFAYLLFPEYSKVFHIPDDGFLYRMDARHLHTAVNCGPFSRTHLVIISDQN